MSYQIAEEISSFWNLLALPIILGITAIFLIMYLIGQSNRNKLIDWLIDDSQGKYVNGLFIQCI